MKALGALFLTGSVAVALAMAQYPRITRIEAEITVVDLEGKPIEGADVRLGFPRYGGGRKDVMVSGKTDREGIVRLAGEAESDYGMSVRCAGYYEHREPQRSIDSPIQMEKHGRGLQRIRVELRPIANPVVGIGRYFVGLRIPEVGQEMGFDAEIGDFVPPLGKGKVTDFIFVMRGRFDSATDYEQTFEIKTVRPMDGIVPFRKRPHPGSAFRYDYVAPLDGYVPSKIWHRQRKGNKASEDDDPNAAYYFRIRSELDEKGQVKRALYGIIAKDCLFGHDKPGEFFFTLSYLLNTDWNRNMEFDSEKSHERGREIGK